MLGDTAVANRRSAIINAAERVFAARGFDAGTIRQIAREAGVAEGLIYHYFENKEALMYAVIHERSVLSWLQRPEALREDVPVDEGLRIFAAEAVSRLTASGDLLAIVWSQVATNPSLAATLGRAVREVTDRLAEYLDRKIARGELREFDTTVAARMFTGCFVSFVIQQHRLSPPLKLLSAESYVDSMIDIFAHGMLPSASIQKECDDETE